MNPQISNTYFAKDYTIYEIDEIDSTNTFFKKNYSKYEHKSVLIAKKQTHGRGRFERIWESKNDICFSILLKENFKNNIIVPLAICLALEDFNIHAGIKWPNDIYYENKKLSGVLIEDIFTPNFTASVVGIGINMESKPSVNGIGILDINQNINKENIISKTLYYYEKLANYENSILLSAYKYYSIVLNKNIVYNSSTYNVKDITIDGYLLVKNEKETKIISSNEIDFKLSLINLN